MAGPVDIRWTKTVGPGGVEIFHANTSSGEVEVRMTGGRWLAYLGNIILASALNPVRCKRLAEEKLESMRRAGSVKRVEAGR